MLRHAIGSILQTMNLWHGKGFIWTVGVYIKGVTWSTDEFLGRHIVVCWFLKSFAWERTYRSANLAARGRENVLFRTLRAFVLRCMFQDIIFMHSKWVTERESKYWVLMEFTEPGKSSSPLAKWSRPIFRLGCYPGLLKATSQKSKPYL